MHKRRQRNLQETGRASPSHAKPGREPWGIPTRSVELAIGESEPPYAWLSASSTAAWKPRRVFEAPEAMSMAFGSCVSTISSQ